MNKPAKPKNQHWVPQFYLRRFANDQAASSTEPQIWVGDFSAETVMTRSTSIKKVCAGNFMYTPKIDNTSREWALDDELGKIESRAADVWQGFVDHGPESLGEAARDHVATFVAALHLRNEYLRNLTRTAMDNRDQLYGRPEGPAPGEWSLGEVDPSDLARTFANSVIEGIPRITDIIACKTWYIGASAKGLLLTSDRPVLLRQDRRVRPDVSDPDTMLALPLSPNRVLVMYGEPSATPSSRTELDTGFIATLNTLQALHCNRFILSHVEPESLPTVQPLATIKQHRENRQEMTEEPSTVHEKAR